MQTFNPTGTAGLEVLFYLSGWWKWHLLVGRCYYEWQSNGIKNGREWSWWKKVWKRSCEVKSTGRARTANWELQGRRASRWEPRDRQSCCMRKQEWVNGIVWTARGMSWRHVLYIYISLQYAFYFQVTLGALTFQASAIQNCFLKSWGAKNKIKC